MHLVTGGSGYFGLRLVKALRARGHAVRIFDLNDARDRPPEVELFQGDIRDGDAIRRACRGAVRVYHNVAQVPLAKDAELFWTVNRDGTRGLLEACLDQGVEKVVYTSSSAVFGIPRSNPVDESVEPMPCENYGRAKLEGERICNAMVGRGLDVSIIRPRTILGHGRLGIMQILFEWIRKGWNVPVFDGGENIYQFVHADDLAESCLLAAERPGPETFNIGAARFGSMRESLQGLVDHARTGSRIVSLPMGLTSLGMRLTGRLGLSPLGDYHALMSGRSLYFDISKAERLLAWTPRYSNVEMLCESYDWYLRNREQVLTAQGGSHHQRAVKQKVLHWVGWTLAHLPSESTWWPWP